jgi:hypothetical protein
MSLASFLRSLFWPSSRERERKNSSKEMDGESDVAVAVQTLMSVGINFLAVDFDVRLRLKYAPLIRLITVVH